MAVLQEYKCPCCGGAIGFDSTAQKMKCPYCDTEFEMEALLAYDADLKKDAPDDMHWEPASETWQETEGVTSYVCRSCGGEILGDRTTAATSCPFCGNPVVIMGQVSGDLKPDLVIPFQLDKEAAKAAMRRHLQGKKLLPKLFKDENHIDQIRGIYVPVWLFGADADAEIRYRATRMRVWSDANFNYTETGFYAVTRSGTLGFDAVPVDGSSKMPDDFMESLEPYDLSQAVDFQTAYLAGYFADRYDVGTEESVGRANERVKKSTEDAFAATVHGFDTVKAEASHIAVQNGKAKYALFPVWLLNTTWNGEKYTFAMNGQTGKFVGNLPMDRAAFRRWFVLLFGAGAAVSYLVAWLIHLL